MKKINYLSFALCFLMFSCSTLTDSSSVNQEIQPTDLESSNSSASVEEDKPIDVKPLQE